MNKFAEPSFYGTTAANPAPETLTFAQLKETVDALKAQNPLMGMEPVESRWIPEGMTVLMNRTQIALCRDGKVVVVDKPDLFKPMLPRF
jgi:hypothetical protein